MSQGSGGSYSSSDAVFAYLLAVFGTTSLCLDWIFFSALSRPSATSSLLSFRLGMCLALPPLLSPRVTSRSRFLLPRLSPGLTPSFPGAGEHLPPSASRLRLLLPAAPSAAIRLVMASVRGEDTKVSGFSV